MFSPGAIVLSSLFPSPEGLCNKLLQKNVQPSDIVFRVPWERGETVNSAKAPQSTRSRFSLGQNRRQSGHAFRLQFGDLPKAIGNPIISIDMASENHDNWTYGLIAMPSVKSLHHNTPQSMCNTVQWYKSMISIHVEVML